MLSRTARLVRFGRQRQRIAKGMTSRLIRAAQNSSLPSSKQHISVSVYRKQDWSPCLRLRDGANDVAQLETFLREQAPDGKRAVETIRYHYEVC